MESQRRFRQFCDIDDYAEGEDYNPKHSLATPALTLTLCMHFTCQIIKNITHKNQALTFFDANLQAPPTLTSTTREPLLCDDDFEAGALAIGLVVFERFVS